MTEKAISPLRRRLIEDMTIRRLSANTQHQYIRHVKSFADFVGRSLDKATAEDVHRYQLHLGSIGTTIPTVNAGASALRFFFKVTLKRRDLADAVVSVREPRRLPVVLSPEEVARLLASTTNIKHRAALSLTYATGLRRSEVVSLRLTDIDSDRMLIRVEQGKGKKDRYVILSPHLLELLREWWRVAPLKPEEALSDAQRQAASGNEWSDHTLYSRQNDKRLGAIIIIMLSRDAKFARDSPLEGAVSSEPVSAPLFPANRVKYRELQRLAPDQALDLLEKASILNALRKRFPGEANRGKPSAVSGN